MEAWGVGFEAAECKKYRQALAEKLKQVEEEAHQRAGRIFSVSSPAEVATLLFEELKLLPPSKGSEGSKQGGRPRKGKLPSTSKKVLQGLIAKHAVVEKILEYRKIVSLLGKYVDVLPKYVRRREGGPGRIHTAWLQTGTPTGRLAVQHPNLQCIPHVQSICLSSGQSVEVSIRNCFVPTVGSVLMSADYSQLELRLMAHFSQDPALLDILRSGGDLFRLIAAQWLGKTDTDISKKERNHAKGMCYGILYGMGTHSLAQQLEVTAEEAGALLEEFKATYKGVNNFLLQSIESCRQKGYILTIAGRKRYFPTINSSSVNERRAAERCAINSITQGSAADLVKTAMINIHSLLTEHWAASPLPTTRSTPTREQQLVPRLIMQIHDELVLEVPETAVRVVAQIVRREMENAVQLTVPMPVSISIGHTWGSLQPLQEEEEDKICT